MDTSPFKFQAPSSCSHHDSYQQRRQEFLHNTVHKAKYGDLTFPTEELQANSLYQASLASKFTSEFQEDFYYDLAMKYKDQIRNHTLFNDIYSMPKGVLHHHHMTSSLDVDLCKEFMVGNPNIYMRQFTHIKTNYPSRLVYTIEPKEGDVPLQRLLDEWRQVNPGKDVREYFAENLSMFPEELAKAKNNNEC